MDPRTEPLKVELENGRLVISIGIDTLCHCAEVCERFYDAEHDSYAVKVTDQDVFAREIVLALNHEKENGETPVTDLLDTAFEKAVDDGCDGVDHGEGAHDGQV